MNLSLKRIYLSLFVACIGLLVGACNDEDDMDIFVGRLWKIGNLYDVQGKPLKEDESKILSRENSFYIKFENNHIFTGRTFEKNFSGSWDVDLKKRTIYLRFTDTGNPTDALSKKVIERLGKSASYEGDYKFLKLKEENSSAYILCRPL